MSQDPVGTVTSSAALPQGFLRKSLNSRSEVLLIAVEARALLQCQMERIHADPSAMIHLGQAMMSALLLQALGDTSENDRVQCEWMVNGPFGNLYAESLGTGRVRGTIGSPQAGPAALGQPLGEGLFQVRRHHSGALSTGMINSTGRVSTDLVDFLERSEQRACGSNLSVKIEYDEARAEAGYANPFFVKSAHAFLIHVLPQESDAKRDEVLRSWDAQIRVLGPISQWKLSEDSATATQEMIQMLSMQQDIPSIFGNEIELYCTCSEERAARALALVEANTSPGEEIPSEAPTVRCEFCGSVYRIGSA